MSNEKRSRGFDIQSEISPSSAPAVSDPSATKPEVVTADNDDGQPGTVTSLFEARPTSNGEPYAEGSVGYRIAAMVAMFLLALVAMVIWYYGR